MELSWIEAGDVIVKRGGSVNPSKHHDEVFELYSVPAFDTRQPEIAIGSDIGSAKQNLKPKDVLLCKIVPHIRRSWVVGQDNGLRLIGSGEWIVFRSEKFWPDYLRHLLVSDWFHARFMQTVAGVGGSLLRARPAEVAKIKIPLPPLKEQKRVASILDKADALRQKRCKAIAKLQELVQSVFLDVFGDPVTNPKRWGRVKFGELIKTLTDYHANGSYKALKEHVELLDTPDFALMIRTTDLENNNFINGVKYISKGAYDFLSKSKVYGEEIIINKIGSAGEVYFMPTLNRPVSLGMNQFLIRTNRKVLTKYVYHYLKTPYGDSLIKSNVRGAVTKTITKNAVREIDILLPPLIKQKEFINKLGYISKLSRYNLRHSEKLDTFFNSLQQRAFKGEL